MNPIPSHVRYLTLRADSLMGLFRRLDAPARRTALRALAESVAEHGGDSAARYRARDGDAADGLSTIASQAAQLGWGDWHLSRVGDDELQLEVRNSPFAQGYGAADEPVCAAIAGMLQAVARLALGAAVAASEHECAATGAAACRFRARRIDAG